MQIIRSDRRGERRYEVNLNLKYAPRKGSSADFEGVGKTCNVSRAGLSFECDRVLPVGMQLELLVQWPVRLNDLWPVELRMYARIVRSAPGETAVRINWYEFRRAQASMDHQNSFVA